MSCNDSLFLSYPSFFMLCQHRIIATIRWFTVLALVLVLSKEACADQQSGLDHRIMIDPASAGLILQTPVNGLAIPVRLHMGNFDFSRAGENSSGLTFTSSGRERLASRIELWDTANELGLVWVQLGLLPANGLALKLHAGSPDNANAALAPLYDEHQTAVLSFDGTGQHDASIYHNDLLDVPALDQVGVLGNAANLHGMPLVLKASESLQLNGSGWTLLTWVKLADASSPATLYEQQANGKGLRVEIKDSQLHLHIDGPLTSVDLVGGSLRAQTWQHLGIAIGNGQAALYLDGEKVAQTDAYLPKVKADVRLGTGLTGLLDQVELSNVVRSSDWIHATFTAQRPDSRLISLMGDDAEQIANSSYFGLLMSNLTTDAWTVIALLVMMLVIALGVMVDKVLLVLNVIKANDAFIQCFQAVVDGATLMEFQPKEAFFAFSTLLPIYQGGVHEVKRRIPGGKESPLTSLVLSPQSIGTVKAVVESVKTRQVHRLNERLVLLTIAISGGPFIGLLGTVMGVMITFSSIASAGDVNVNAIAPGIAAALLSTVTGLAVAIPSLFAYNWLATRIQKLCDEMDMFADEFIARMAEAYSSQTP